MEKRANEKGGIDVTKTWGRCTWINVKKLSK
jgi:hypothetical protein